MGVYISTHVIKKILWKRFSILIWPNVTRSCMHFSISKLFEKTLGDSGTLSFNFSEAFVTTSFDLTFVACYFVFFDTICYFIMWAPKATQLMGLPFDLTTTTIENVTNSCLLQIFSFPMTLQYNSFIFPTNFLFGKLLFVLGPKNLFIFVVLTLALMIDKTSLPKFYKP